MRATSASTQEIARSVVLGARGGRPRGRTETEGRAGAEGRAKARGPGLRVLTDLERLVEPPVDESVGVIERVASVLRMGSIRTW